MPQSSSQTQSIETFRHPGSETSIGPFMGAGAIAATRDEWPKEQNGVSVLDISQAPIPEWVVDQWRQILLENDELRSPYFTPEFSIAAARSRAQTFLIVVARQGKVLALLPYHDLGRGRSIPIGGAINDYQGVIARHANDFQIESMLAAARLKTYRFHSWHWPKQTVADRYSVSSLIETSAMISQPNSTDYLKEIAGRSIAIRRQGQKTRKMTRELGPVRFQMHDDDPATLDWLIRLKREKYHRTNCTDFFERQWSRDLLHNLHAAENPNVRGFLSVLYAGSHRVAGHFGIATDDVLHYWYPVFERQWHRYSPGTELFLKIADQARSEGISRIDMGYGEERFKMRITNCSDSLLVGCIGASAVQLSLEKVMSQMRNRVVRSRYRETIRDTIRIIWPSAGKPKVD